jgi:hypothetical protein
LSGVFAGQNRQCWTPLHSTTEPSGREDAAASRMLAAIARDLEEEPEDELRSSFDARTVPE